MARGRKAAAVPASKAVPGLIYAWKDPANDRLVRFCVTATVVRRKAADGGPSDYESLIEGYIAEPKASRVIQTIKPNELLGQFDEYQELVKRQTQEKAEEFRKKKEKLDKQLRLRELLYQVTGLQKPLDPDGYNQPFRVAYSDVDLNEIGAMALLAFLEKTLAKSEAA